MYKKLLLALPLLLTSCNLNQGADGYTFERKEFTQTKIELEVQEYPSLFALQVDAGKAGLNTDTTLAYSSWYGNHKCIIHIVDPAVQYKPEALGHEVLHCVHGNWHSLPKR